MTSWEAMEWASRRLADHGIENPRLNAELLLAHTLHLGREGLYARLREPIGEQEEAALRDLVQRRISGEPLQYLIGRQEFWSMDFSVDGRVLIPRPETEVLVENTLHVLTTLDPGKTPSLLEIGTGSGAVAIALAKEVKGMFLVATDLSSGALALAKENARRQGVLPRIQFVRGDLFGPFREFEGGELFDVILSNPPYVAGSEWNQLPREVKEFEPTRALYGGADGLDLYRRITGKTSFYLRPGGWLLLEIGQGQASRVCELIEAHGEFASPDRVRDFSGIERVVKAQKRWNGQRSV